MPTSTAPTPTATLPFDSTWSATFFPNESLSGTGVAVTGINSLTFDWGRGEPVVNGSAVTGIGTDHFSARFTTSLNLTPRQYTFVTTADDGVRLYINGALVIDQFFARPLQVDYVSVEVTSSPVTVTLEYLEVTGQAIVGFQWGLTSTPIPPSPTPIPIYNPSWSAQFYPNNNFVGSGVAIGNIQALNFNWGAGSPIINGVTVPGIPVDNFSARFTTTQGIVPGLYQFVVSSDDGFRLYVNGALVLNRWFGRVLTTDTVLVSIPRSPVTITVEYFEMLDQAILQVQWFALATAVPTPTPIQWPPPQRNYFTVAQPMLTWNPVSWAVRYDVQVASDAAFSSTVTVDAGNVLSLTWPSALSNGIHYWRVRACSAAATCAGWSLPESFVVKLP